MVQERMLTSLLEIFILSYWCKENGLTINCQKTNFMVFHKQGDYRFDVTENMIVDEKMVERVYSFKYLGIHLDPRSFTFRR